VSEPPVACDESQLKCPDCVVETATVTHGMTTTNLNNGAWCIGNWDDALGVSIRGDDLIVPGVDYVLARRRYLDKFEVSLQMMFDGNVNAAGVSHAPLNVLEGLELNRRAFITAVVNPPTSGAIQRTLNLTLVDGTVVSGPIHCEEFRFQRDGLDGIGRGIWRITLTEGLS
jgi:hypothetical protein